MNPAVDQDNVPIKAIRTLLRVAAAQGYDVEQVRRATGLPANIDTLCADTRLPTEVYSRLYKQVMRLLQDEAFGLSAPTRSPPGTFRIMCLYIIHCPTLRKALERCVEFFDFCDSFHQPLQQRRRAVHSVGDGLARLTLYSPQRPGDPDNLRGDSSALYMMYRFFSWLTGQHLPLMEVEFLAPEPSPAAAERVRGLFGCKVRFGAACTALLLPQDCLDLPIVQTEQSLIEFLRSAPYPLMSRQERRHDHGLVADRVRALLGHDFSRPFPGAEQIASQLNMSARTLHRHLRRENTSYQRIKDECRSEAAMVYMSRPELTISAVAMLMGFQDASAFHRSFKKWTGLSPGDYRRRELRHH